MVDEKKLPKQWFCSMNKSDPERARCSAPEEEYNDAVQTQSPESLADMKARKHLRVWVRRLQCNEAYEARQPTLTRGKKKATTSSAKDPYEWIRCCNQACGKWRAILRIMDAKGSVMDRAKDGEWYCVMNTWDEKVCGRVNCQMLLTLSSVNRNPHPFMLCVRWRVAPPPRRISPPLAARRGSCRTSKMEPLTHQQEARE
jgi:hypothetical protein